MTNASERKHTAPEEVTSSPGFMGFTDCNRGSGFGSSQERALGIDEQGPVGLRMPEGHSVLSPTTDTPKRGAGQESVVKGPPVDTVAAGTPGADPWLGGNTAWVVLLLSTQTQSTAEQRGHVFVHLVT